MWGPPQASEVTPITSHANARSTVTADRSRPTHRLSPASATEHVPSRCAPSASFCLGELRLELSAATGAARLVITHRRRRDVYIIDPGSLYAWARRVSQVLTLVPAGSPSERAEYRTPYLIDREGRPAIAVEALVARQLVTYRLVGAISGDEAAGLMDADVVVELIEAAQGTARYSDVPTPTE